MNGIVTSALAANRLHSAILSVKAKFSSGMAAGRCFDTLTA
jgi:hypothetical protein